jgi:hypothetical protein
MEEYNILHTPVKTESGKEIDSWSWADSMGATICYCFASRSRKTRFFDVLHNIRGLSHSNKYYIVAKLDLDDPEMHNDEVKERLKDHPEVIVRWGYSQGKIHAINRSLEDLPPYDIVVMQSDDIVWDVPGFDDIIRQAFAEHDPNFEKAIHFPDDHGKRKTIIVSILGINLYKQLGYLYEPSFFSVFADDFFTYQVRKMNKYTYVDKRLFTHLHPIWGSIPWDDQYKATEAKENYAKDRETFLRLQANYKTL